jgi:hypothetical protein
MKLVDAEPYIRYNDGSFGYACEDCMKRWRKEGMLYVTPEENRRLASGSS